MITSLEPVNELEHALDAVRSGRLPVLDFLRVLIRSDLAFPSATEVFADGTGFRPLLFLIAAASPAEAVDFYRSKGEMADKYLVIAWSDPDTYSIAVQWIHVEMR